MDDDLLKHGNDIINATVDVVNQDLDVTDAVAIVRSAIAHFDDLDESLVQELLTSIANFRPGQDIAKFGGRNVEILCQSAKFRRLKFE